MEMVSVEKKEHIKRERVASAEIIVTGSKQEPYYQIKYYDLTDEEYHIGYGSYHLDMVFDWLKECFEIIEGKEYFYKAKKQIVEAFQYTGRLKDDGGNYCVPIWAVEAYESGKLFYENYKNNKNLFVDLKKVIYLVSIGDYIVKTKEGDIYQYEKELFEQLFERVK